MVGTQRSANRPLTRGRGSNNSEGSSIFSSPMFAIFGIVVYYLIYVTLIDPPTSEFSPISFQNWDTVGQQTSDISESIDFDEGAYNGFDLPGGTYYTDEDEDDDDDDDDDSNNNLDDDSNFDGNESDDNGDDDDDENFINNSFDNPDEGNESDDDGDDDDDDIARHRRRW